MDTSLDSLLNDFLLHTLSLQQRVLDDDSEPEEWIDLLDKRQVVLESISRCLEKGFSFSEIQKKNYLQPAYEVDQKIIPIMDRKKQDLGSEIMNMKRSQAVTQQYGDFGSTYSPYGAFFDKKK
ncbi:flagellar protein FliT [Paenibacillus sp. PL91]|uniref:flagellar protein FliT n=1 Tax=Paenibacillus sp. PL91 TaxID=2729538 RepID=UPI00145D4102|nr:flagellar protein FliT [Paenibacillus sp. PL91]MBC9201920.1 flagellar protein FliT [Paenibacillus sp. PL91]